MCQTNKIEKCVNIILFTKYVGINIKQTRVKMERKVIGTTSVGFYLAQLISNAFFALIPAIVPWNPRKCYLLLSRPYELKGNG